MTAAYGTDVKSQEDDCWYAAHKWKAGCLCHLCRTGSSLLHFWLAACATTPVKSGTDEGLTLLPIYRCTRQKGASPIRSIVGRWKLSFLAAPLSVQYSYRYENILRIREVLGHPIDAEISPKAPSEKAQTTVSENRYTFPRIDVFRTAILSLLAPTENNERA